jgi:hypothetical protein
MIIKQHEDVVSVGNTRKVVQKTPHKYHYNNGSPTIGNQKCLISSPPKIYEGRVCEN